MDVTTAYLQSKLEKPVPMRPPKGYERNGPNGRPMVMLLKRSLYGLKQSGNNWNRCIDAWFKGQGFNPGNADLCLYIKKDRNGHIVMIVCLYVDDLMIVAPTDEHIEAFKAEIKKAFSMKDLGPLKYLLGMEITFSGGAVHISQRKYVQDMLKVYDMDQCHPTRTPTSDGQRLTKGQQPQGGKA
jgi:hypothetical protein